MMKRTKSRKPQYLVSRDLIISTSKSNLFDTDLVKTLLYESGITNPDDLEGQLIIITSDRPVESKRI